MGMSLKGKGDLEKLDDVSINQLIGKLLEKQDIELKTRILSPEGVLGLHAFGNFLKLDGNTGSSKFLLDELEYYLDIMVSLNGKGREGIEKIFANLIDKESLSLSFSEKLSRERK